MGGWHHGQKASSAQVQGCPCKPAGCPALKCRWLSQTVLSPFEHQSWPAFFPKMESEIPTLALWPNQPLFAFSSTLGLKLLLICYLFLSDIPRPVRFLLEIDMIKVLSSGSDWSWGHSYSSATNTFWWRQPWPQSACHTPSTDSSLDAVDVSVLLFSSLTMFVVQLSPQIHFSSLSGSLRGHFTISSIKKWAFHECHTGVEEGSEWEQALCFGGWVAATPLWPREQSRSAITFLDGLSLSYLTSVSVRGWGSGWQWRPIPGLVAHVGMAAPEITMVCVCLFGLAFPLLFPHIPRYSEV